MSSTQKIKVLMRAPCSAAVLALSLAGSFLLWAAPAASTEAAVVIPAPVIDAPRSSTAETAVLAGGCFWGVQGVFQHVKGVTNAVSGYSGGAAETANYETVGTGQTGHAEAVQITFDPQQISFGQILQIYFSVAHDPTQFNRQGPDTGTQYRSAIFPTDTDQKRVAQSYVDQLDRSGVFHKPIVTKIEQFKGFYPAEDYHQDFLTTHPLYPYIVINDLPKIRNLKQLFVNTYREKPILVGGSKS